MNMKTKLSDAAVVGKIENYLNQNGPTLALFGGLIGLGCTLYAAFKASKSVVKVNEDYAKKEAEIASESISDDEKASKTKDLKLERNIKYVLAYKWAILAGFGSAGFMILCNYLNGAKIAGLTAALALSEDKLKKLVKNGKEMIGEEKFKDIENKTLEDLVRKNFMDDDGPIIIRPSEGKGDGDIYVDTLSGAQFQFHGTEDELKDVLNDCGDICFRHDGIPVSKYYNKLGIPTPPWVGGFWGPNAPFRATIGRRELFGATFKTIELAYMPTDPKKAGVIGA